jgi:hypothetical protein
MDTVTFATDKIDNPSFGELPIRGADPYLLWTLVSSTDRLAQIRSSNAGGKSFVQVLIEVYQLDDNEATQKKKRDGIKKLLNDFDTYGVNMRAAYDFKSHRFATALIVANKFPKFVTEMGRLGIRFELGHSLTASSPSNSLTSNTGKEKPPRVWGSWKNDQNDPLPDGKVVAIVDYGCPFLHQSFLDESGESRIKYVWFQDSYDFDPNAQLIMPSVFKGQSEEFGAGNRLFPYGRELRARHIADLKRKFPEPRFAYNAIGYDLMRSHSSHGGHVMSIAAGYPNPLVSEAAERCDASKADIIFVQLPRSTVADSSGGGMNVHVLDALRYIAARTTDSSDVVVNLSFGTHAGPHDGTSMLEQAIDDLIATERARRDGRQFNVVIPMGNGFNAASHAKFEITKQKSVELEWDIAPDDRTDSFLEFWYADDSSISVAVKPPGSDDWLESVAKNQVASFGRPNNPCCTIVNVGNVTSRNHNNVALVAIAPTSGQQGCVTAPYGIWQVKVSTTQDGPISVDGWIERDDPIFDSASDRQSRFVVKAQADDQQNYPAGNITKEGTLNSYAAAKHIHVVGGIVHVSGTSKELAMANYSAAGPIRTRSTGTKTPDFLAISDETDVLLGRNAGGNHDHAWVRRNGTSVAAPQLTRALINNPLGIHSLPVTAITSSTPSTPDAMRSSPPLVSERAGASRVV